MQKEKLIVLYIMLLSYTSLNAQMHFELGVNYMDGSFSKVGIGAYLEPRYALNKNVDLALHLGLNSFLGYEQDRTQSRRITSGQIPVIRFNYIHRFPAEDKTEIPYVGVGAGTYLAVGDPQLFKGVKAGATLSAGLLFGRSNLGLDVNLIPNYSFIVIKYGIRVLSRKR